MTNYRSQKESVLDLLDNQRANEQIDRRQTEKELLDVINLKKYEIDILHQVNTRLGAELALLQRKLGIDHEAILHELESLNEVTVAFHYETEQMQYLDQLFMAYDDTLLKQKKTIALLFSTLQDGERKAESLVRDNEYLLAENQNKCRKILEIYHKGSPEDSLVPSYHRLQRQVEVQRIQTVAEENQYLLIQAKQLEDKCSLLEAELQQSKAMADKYFQSYKTQTEQLKETLMKVDDLVKIKQVLQRKFDELSQENIDLETVKTLLESKASKFEAECKNLKTQFFALKKTSREEIDKASLEADSAKFESENAIKRERETFAKQMGLEKELEAAKDINRAQKRELEKLRGDFEQTLKMCEAYESKIASSARKEENVRLVIEENRQRLDEALLERDKTNLKAQQLEKLVDNLQAKHRGEMTTMKATFERIINSQNEKIRVFEDEKEENESLITQNELTMKNQVQKLRRENAHLREENSKFLTNIKMQSGSEILARIRELEQKNESLSKLLSQKERNNREDKDNNDEIITNYENENRELNRVVEKERNNAASAIRELTQVKSKLAIASNEKECLENEIQKLKRNMDLRSYGGHDQRDSKIRDLEQKLQEATVKEKNTRQKAIQMLQKYDEAEEKLKLQYENRIQDLEDEIAKLKNKLNRM